MILVFFLYFILSILNCIFLSFFSCSFSLTNTNEFRFDARMWLFHFILFHSKQRYAARATRDFCCSSIMWNANKHTTWTIWMCEYIWRFFFLFHFRFLIVLKRNSLMLIIHFTRVEQSNERKTTPKTITKIEIHLRSGVFVWFCKFIHYNWTEVMLLTRYWVENLYLNSINFLFDFDMALFG